MHIRQIKNKKLHVKSATEATTAIVNCEIDGYMRLYRSYYTHINTRGFTIWGRHLELVAAVATSYWRPLNRTSVVIVAAVATITFGVLSTGQLLHTHTYIKHLIYYY